MLLLFSEFIIKSRKRCLVTWREGRVNLYVHSARGRSFCCARALQKKD